MFSVYVKFVKQKENCKEINKQLSEKLCKFVLSLSRLSRQQEINKFSERAKT